MNIITCLCGKEFTDENTAMIDFPKNKNGNGLQYVYNSKKIFSFFQHSRNCKSYKYFKRIEIQKLFENYGAKILELWAEGYSILELLSNDICSFIVPINGVWEENKYYLNHDELTNFIKNSGVFYKHKKEHIERKLNKTIETNLKKYGVINVGCLESHKEKLRSSNESKINPFSTKEFHIMEYIKGKRALNTEKFDEYNKQVILLTQKNKKLLGIPEVCFYTNLKITDQKKYDYNMLNYATIDHKVSILYGFENNISVEEISHISNLCWCARFVNIIKKEKTLDQFLNSESYKRLQNVLPMLHILIKENYEDN